MKKILATLLLIPVVLCTGCSTQKEEKAVDYFDFTAKEIVSKLETDWLIELDPVTIVDDDDKTTKIATYTSQSDVFNFDGYTIDAMMHYRIYYNNITDKVSEIAFFFDKNSMDDISEARARFYYHIYSIAETIDPDANMNEIGNALSDVDGTSEETDGTGYYEGDKFDLLAFSTDTMFDAMFTANNIS